jgi:cytochrome c5
MKPFKSIIVLLIIGSGIFLFACSEGVQKDKKPADEQNLTNNKTDTNAFAIKEGDIKMNHPLNQDWIATGQRIYELKCQACHKLTDEKLVGPGWKGVTKRRTPVWIMNMICNTQAMLDKDPEARKLIENCLIRMPTQNLMIDDARKVLEFQLSNDGEK